MPDHVLITYVVRYPKSEWSRADAWHHLRDQQIPGCPERWIAGWSGARTPLGVWSIGFQKCHDADHWAWLYRGAPRSIDWKLDRTKSNP